MNAYVNRFPKVRETIRRRQSRLLLPFCLALAYLLAGCRAYGPYVSEGERALALQPSSPLIPGQDTQLLRNKWRIVDVMRDGRPVQLAAIAPVILEFEAERGMLGVQETNCNTASYVIVASDERHFRLVPHTSTAVSCGEIGDQQANELHEALLATTQYALQDHQLILRSDGARTGDVRIVGQVVQPPPSPKDVWCFDLVHYPDGRHTIFADEPGAGAGTMAATLPGVTVQQRCFPTWAGAAYYITGGTVVLSPYAVKQDYLDAVKAFLDRPLPALPAATSTP
jgi:hypothetical protein